MLVKHAARWFNVRGSHLEGLAGSVLLDAPLQQRGVQTRHAANISNISHHMNIREWQAGSGAHEAHRGVISLTL
eukprot:2955802-Pyramimonas_sp.AAC.1